MITESNAQPESSSRQEQRTTKNSLLHESSATKTMRKKNRNNKNRNKIFVFGHKKKYEKKNYEGKRNGIKQQRKASSIN